MSNSRDDFHKRLAKLEKAPTVKVRARTDGRMGIYDNEEEERRKRAKFPWRRLFVTLIIAWLGLIAVKTYVVNDMGEAAYQARLAELRAGDQMQQIAAIAIARGPIMMAMEGAFFAKGDGREAEIENAPEEPSEASGS
ncbi:hypothetical protein GCM10007939_00540 [Amylibacter marinus]|uniref:Cell division protein FtsL n=1 Tax=Amylibacter marinus TaxID=1475483 RepID=A0ABQ5VRH3_9RHOB|nr:hypothetical protein [Amylibacter marinus]GLQ33771.1 hypothetical protein GCM10007939_00540 [Amylibacter marinus]